MIKFKAPLLYALLTLFSSPLFADDSTSHDKSEMTISGGSSASVDVNNYKSLFSNIRGKESDIAHGRTGGVSAYGYVRVSEDASYVRIYDVGHNLLRTLSCFKNCSMTKNSNAVVYKNAGYIGDSEMVRLPTENIDYVVVTNLYVKIGYQGHIYYGYWKD